MFVLFWALLAGLPADKSERDKETGGEAESAGNDVNHVFRERKGHIPALVGHR